MSTSSDTKTSKRKRIFDIIQIAGGDDPASRAFDLIIIVVIILSIIITTAQTFSLPASADRVLFFLDLICTLVFTIEYVLRLWTADYLYPGSRLPWLKFILSPGAIIDLFSFLPFYLAGMIPAGMVVFRLIRVARILRLFRINRFLDPVAAILTVLKKKASLLLASFFLVFVLMFSSSLLMYYAEHEATGYGDIVPVTVLGKMLAIIITLLGLCLVAIPTGIITAGFMEAARDPAALNPKDADHEPAPDAKDVFGDNDLP